MQVGDLVKYTYWEEGVHTVLGVVLRGGKYNAYILLNDQTEPGWISKEYLKVVSQCQ